MGTISTTITQPNQLIVSVDSFTLPSCGSVGTGSNTTNDGTIVVTSTGGTGTKEYSKDGGVNYQSSGTFSGLTSGTYTIHVKDENDCTGSTTQNIVRTTV